MDLNINNKLDVILQEIKKIKDKEIKLSSIIEGRPYQSEKTDEINTALADASLEFGKIEINRQNPYLATGYADLDAVMTKIRPILGKHGLHISQQKKQIDGRTLLVTRVWHSSAQWIESRIFLNPSDNSIESYASNLNAMKRFEIMDLLGITVIDDPFDDDGEADMKQKRKDTIKGTKIKDLIDKEKDKPTYETITNEQYEELMYELDEHGDLVAEILDGLKLRTLRELPKNRYKPTRDRIKRIINARNNA